MTRIVFRRGAAVAWTAANPVLWMSERGFEEDTGRWKTGDGETPWNDLPYDLGADAVGDAVAAYLDEFPPGGTDLTFNRNATTVTVLSATGTDAVLPAADATNAGVMTAAMQTKLAGIATGAEVNVNPDWSAGSGDAQILNKPSTFPPSAHTHAVADITISGTPNGSKFLRDDGSWATPSGSGGGVTSVVPGTNIDVDNTDPNNPVVSVESLTASDITDFSAAADARITAQPTTGAGSIVRAASPTFTGTVSGITKSMVGLGSVDNTADTAKPVSSAQQAALDGKQNLDAELTAIAGLTSAANQVPYFTGSGTAALTGFTAAGRALVDDADAAAQRATLQLGPLAAATPTGTPSATTFLRGDNTWATPSAGGLAAQAMYVATAETVASGGSYTDLTTTTDQVTITVGASGVAIVSIGAWFGASAANAQAYISFAASGSNTLSADDSRCVYVRAVAGSSVIGGTESSFTLTGLTPGSTTFKMKYKAAGGTGTYEHRRISVLTF